MKSFLTSLIFLFISTFCYSQKFNWAETGKCISPESAFAKDIAVDKEGNSYVLGEFNSKMHLLSDSLVAIDNNGADLFLLKINSSGNLIWKKVIGAYLADEGKKISVSGNNVYILIASQSVPLNMEDSIFNISGISLMKLDSSGIFQWIENAAFSVNPGSKSMGLTCDEDNVYVCASDGVRKFTSEGNLLWSQIPNGLLVSQDARLQKNHLLLTGNFFGSVVFGSKLISSVNNSQDAFTAQMDTSGNVEWLNAVGGSSMEEESGSGVCSDLFGNVYSAGFRSNEDLTFAGDTIPATGAAHGFMLLKYDSSGNELFSRYADITSFGISGSSEGNDIVCNDSGAVFVTGVAVDTQSFGLDTLFEAGLGNPFIIKYDTAGAEQYISSFIGSNSSGVATGMGIDSSGLLYVTGNYSSANPAFGCLSITGSDSSTFLTQILDTLYTPFPPLEIFRNDSELIAYPSDLEHFQWYLDGSAISGARAIIYKPTTGGSYSFEASDIYGCSGFSDTVNLPYTIIVEQISKPNTLKLYPNPSDGNFSMKFYFSNNSDGRIILLDLMGQILWEENLRINSGQNTFDIKRRELPSGIYFVEISSGEEILTQKVIIQK